MSIIKRLIQEESGQNMIEYILVMALVALVAVGGLKVLGPIISDKLGNLGKQLNDQSTVPVN